MNPNLAVHARSNRRVMGRHDDRRALRVDLVDHRKDGLRRPRIETAGRFVGDEQRGVIDERVRDHDPLCLPQREDRTAGLAPAHVAEALDTSTRTSVPATRTPKRTPGSAARCSTSPASESSRAIAPCASTRVTPGVSSRRRDRPGLSALHAMASRGRWSQRVHRPHLESAQRTFIAVATWSPVESPATRCATSTMPCSLLARTLTS